MKILEAVEMKKKKKKKNRYVLVWPLSSTEVLSVLHKEVNSYDYKEQEV
jgi:hypothetical protein